MLWVNPAYERLTGYTSADVVGNTPAGLLRSGAHSPTFYEEIWDTTSSGHVWKGLITSRRKDGVDFVAERSRALLRRLLPSMALEGGWR